jgi:hypothetical protein
VFWEIGLFGVTDDNVSWIKKLEEKSLALPLLSRTKNKGLIHSATTPVIPNLDMHHRSANQVKYRQLQISLDL